MSVYLGQDKVGVTYLKQANTYELDMEIMQDDIYTPWTRPEGWPDLDSLNLEMSGTESFIYMTFRTGHTNDIFSCGWTLISGQSITIKFGSIENGEFIPADSSFIYTSNTTFTYDFSNTNGFNEGTIVIKVSGRFSKFYLKDFARTAANGGGTLKYYMQPLLERIWYVPELIYFYDGSSTSNTGNGAVTLKRDKISNGTGNSLIQLSYAWYYCMGLQSLDISGLKTQNVTTMTGAFYFCKQLEYLDVSHFNTAKVTQLSSMFYYCQKLKLLDLRNWSISNFASSGLSYTFANCYALNFILGLENFQTNNITTLSNTFSGCRSLKDLSGITNWNTSKVTNLSATFYQCQSLKTLDLSHWNIEAVTQIGSLFYYCLQLEHILFPQGQTSTITGSMQSIFNNCTNLQEVDLNWIKPITSAVTSIGSLFTHCCSLTEINFPEGWDITGCTASESCYRLFSDCYKLQRITGISNWDMSNYNYSLAYSFQYDYCLQELDIKNWKPHPTSMYYFFYQCRSLKEVDLTGWFWENMTGNGVNSIFNGCNSLVSLKGIEHMGDSDKLNTFSGVFSECYCLTSIPNISSWNPSNVTSCSSMFNSCYSLQSLTITNWSLPKCTSLDYMFRYCYNLQELELTNWSVPAVTSAAYTFNQMYSLIKFSGLPLKVAFRIQEAFSLPEDQWIRVFTQLDTVSNKTINMTTNIINSLTSTTKAIATNKGWTLSN